MDLESKLNAADIDRLTGTFFFRAMACALAASGSCATHSQDQIARRALEIVCSVLELEDKLYPELKKKKT